MISLKKEVIILKSSMILSQLVKSREAYKYSDIIEYLNNNTNFYIGLCIYDKDVTKLNEFINENTIYNSSDLINCINENYNYYYIYDSINNKVEIFGFDYDDSCFNSNVKEIILDNLNDDEINNYYEFLDKNYHFY